MDSQDQRKTTPSGNENHGVHVCHKCGWPFPNPHPSAKHRRAHKRICGTIEGYKLTDSEEHSHLTVSDDEHSDEDSATPSPKVEKRSVKEIGSGGVGERTNRSEDEVFSDAVTEFPGSGFSPGVEERLQGVKELDKKVEKVLEGNPDANQSLEADAIAAATRPPTCSTESNLMFNPVVLDSATSQWERTTASQDTRTELLAVGLTSVNGSDLSPIIFETSIDTPKENTNANIGDNGMQSMMCIGQEPDVKGNEEDNVDKTLSDVAVSPNKAASESFEVESMLQQRDGKSSDPVTVGGILESEQEQSDGLGPKFPKFPEHDLFPQVESAQLMEASSDTIQNKADLHEDRNLISPGVLVKVCHTKEGRKEDVHVLSVANELPVVDHPEILIEDFKDHKVVKSKLPLTLDSAEVVRPLEDNNKDSVHEKSCSGSLSSKPGRSVHSSLADMDALEDNFKQESADKKLMLEVSIGGEADMSEFKVTSSEYYGFGDLEVPTDTSRNEAQKIQPNMCAEELLPHSFGGEPSRDTLSGPATRNFSDVTPTVSSVDGKVDHQTNLSGGDYADKTEMCVTDGTKSREGIIEEEHLAKAKTTHESADKKSESTVDQNTSLLGGVDICDNEKARIELSDMAGNESTEEAAAKEKCASNTERALESTCLLSDSACLDRVPDSTELDIDTSNLENIIHTRSISSKCPDEDSQESIKELEVNNDREVVAEFVGPVGLGAESNCEGDTEVSRKYSEIPALKQPGPLPADSEYASKDSATVEDSYSGGRDRSAPGVSSVLLQEDGDDKFTKQPVGVSAADISVDSSSQSDSVEGNWGSVSVVSTQSDAAPAIDAEAPKSEKADLQKPKPAPEGCRSDKSVVFEPPSFMTLVESVGGPDQKAASSGIQTVQNTQPPKSEALQAGRFPSITNAINESQGRKKNEEIIAKVTNWSTGKQHSPLKNLLGEANYAETTPKSPNPRQTTVIQKDENAAKKNTIVTTVNSILGSEAPSDQATKRETGNEWGSPARYPTDNKKEKRKVKGKPSWVPFVCCSSVN